MTPEAAAALVALGVAVVGALVGLYRARSDKTSTLIVAAATAAQTFTSAATQLIEPLQGELSRAHERISAMETTMERLVTAEDTCKRELANVRLEVASLGNGSHVA